MSQPELIKVISLRVLGIPRLEKVLALPCGEKVKAILDEIETIKQREHDLRMELSAIIQSHAPIDEPVVVKPRRIGVRRTAGEVKPTKVAKPAIAMTEIAI